MKRLFTLVAGIGAGPNEDDDSRLRRMVFIWASLAGVPCLAIYCAVYIFLGAPLAAAGVESGWDKVASRLDWASSQFSDGTRSREEIRSAVETDFAYIVQTEHIQFRVPGRTEESTLDLRVTMVFRREADGWRIVHRQADSQRSTQLP